MNVAVGRVILVSLLLVCLPLTAAGSGLAAPGADAGTPAFQQTQPADEDDDNETVRHRDPDTVNEDGDLEEVERQLSGWLSDQLEAGALELSEGQYELARDYVGEEYRDRLGQYVDVAGETDEDRSESFEQAHEEQSELTDAVAEYRETMDAYEQARQDGDEERARELARDLEELADEIDESSQETQTHYDAISEDSDFNLSRASGDIEEVNTDVQADQEAVRQEQFVETELSIATDDETISFTDPLTATGELRTADGSPIANEEIRLDIGNQTLDVETDETGAFEVEYRPVSVPVDADELTIEYVPATQAEYLGSEDTTPVTIEQNDASLDDLSVNLAEASYNSSMIVETTLTVEGEPADGVPLTISIGGEPLGVVETDDGELFSWETLPADVPAGEQTLQVGLPFTGRALTSTTAETPITITETEPDLSVSATQSDDREVSISGTLAVGGNGVSDQSIQLLVDGEPLETVSTDGSGEFETTVALPADIASGDVRIVAQYENSETNLAAAESETTVAFPGGSPLPSWSWAVLAGVGVLLLAAGGTTYWLSRRSTTPVTPEDTTEVPTPETPDNADHTALLAAAADRLSAGDPNTAVRHGYGAVRQHLEGRLGPAGELTHWEIYHQYREREGVSDRVDGALRMVVEGYEQAAFGPRGVTEDEAAMVLERAYTLCEGDAGSGADE